MLRKLTAPVLGTQQRKPRCYSPAYKTVSEVQPKGPLRTTQNPKTRESALTQNSTLALTITPCVSRRVQEGLVTKHKTESPVGRGQSGAAAPGFELGLSDSESLVVHSIWYAFLAKCVRTPRVKGYGR